LQEQGIIQVEYGGLRVLQLQALRTAVPAPRIKVTAPEVREVPQAPEPLKANVPAHVASGA